MKRSACHTIFFLLFFCISATYLQAQTPVAGFYISDLGGFPKSGGCSPQIVRFNDTSNVSYTTTGYNSHFWSFDDRTPPTTSSRENPVFGFITPGTYTVMQVVTHDGITYDTAFVDFTVYDQPVAGFFADQTRGCNPLTVTFTDTSYVANGSITSWLWDFGDGDSSTLQHPTHVFRLFPGGSRCFTVTLRVTSALGCTAVRTITDYICIDPPPVADFSGGGVLCGRPFEADFTDESISNNGLAYHWDFGDTNFSSDKDPTHIYNPDSIKSYTVKLVVTDTVCNEKDSITKIDVVTTNDFDAEFEADTTIACARATVNFTNLSVGNAQSFFWNFGDSETSVSSNPNHVYQTSGTYDVMLVATHSSGCHDTLIKEDYITILPLPVVDFTADTFTTCRTPFTVNFTDNSFSPSSGITDWNWNFGEPPGSADPNPTHIFTGTGNFDVRLTVTDSFGCQETETKAQFIVIEGLTANFSMDTFQGCAPLQVDFTDESSPPGEVSGWTWDFGTGQDSSFQQDPAFTYTTPGMYTVTLTVEDQTGNCFSTTEGSVFVGSIGTPNFLPDSFQVCVDQEVNFENLTVDTTSGQLFCTWDFTGDGAIVTGCDDQTFTYDEPGIYCVSLTVGFNQCEADTCIEIIVMEPKADFDFERNCINPDSIVFNDLSSGAFTWKWYFGDGDSLVDQQHPDIQNPSHVYAGPGQYIVTLVVTNDTTPCVSTMEKTITLEETIVDFDTLSFYPACAGDTVYFSDESEGNIQSYLWNFGDPGSGASNTSTNANPSHIYSSVGVFDVTLTIVDDNGCSKTITKNGMISTSSVSADFEVGAYDPCLSKAPGSSVTVNFTDQSTSSTGIINSWQWDFGNSTGSGQNPSATYATRGRYNVTLTVENDAGCTDTHTETVEIAQPNADFELDYNLYCVGNPVPFINTSNGRNITNYFWEFGDDSTSTARNPVHYYDSSGTYDVTLTVEDVLGCRDSITVTNALTTSTPSICFTSLDTVSNCPEHFACFTDCSDFDSINITSMLWDFGDGSFSQSREPCHMYTRAGLFTVKVVIQYENFCVDSTTQQQYIKIGGATGNIVSDPDTGCSPLDVCLDANTEGAANIFWLYGDPDLEIPFEPGLDDADTICTTYTNPGIFRPAVVLTDAQDTPCTYTLFSDFEIIVDTVFGNFFTDVDTVCRDAPVEFIDSSFSLIDSNKSSWTFLWDFGDGTIDSSNADTIVYVYDSMGTYPVTLTVINNFGCAAVLSKDIFVRDRPTAGFTVSDTSGCDELNVIFVDTSQQGIGAVISDWYWDFGDTATFADTSHAIDTATYDYGMVGGYLPTLIITDEHGCTDTAATTINIYRSPLGILNPDTVDICLRDTVQLLADTGFVSYDWTPGSYLSDSTISNPKAYPLDTTPYYVFIEESHGCHTTDTILINVIPLPPLTVTPHPDTAICLGDTIQLLAVGGSDHRWQPANNWISNPQVNDPLAWPQESTCYTVINVDTLTGCRNKDTTCIRVNVFTPYFIGERQCLGQVTDFLDYSASSEFPIVSWRWDFGVNTSVSDTSIARNPSFLYPDSGSYQVELTVEDSLGCEDTVSRMIRVDHPLITYADADTIICMGERIQLFSGEGDSVYWTPDIDIDDPFSFNPVVSPLFTTEYTANISNGVCPFNSASVLVDVIPTPDVSTIDNTVILQGSSIELTTFTSSIESIIWSPPDSLTCVSCESPVASPVQRTTYYVQVFDEYGCTNSDTVTISVEVRCGEEQVFVANAFTPNGDLENDYVYARLRGVKTLKYFRIFDRWGKLVFETEDETVGWNGLDMNGKQLNSGVYVYAVEAECYFQNTIVKSGNITLIK